MGTPKSIFDKTAGHWAVKGPLPFTTALERDSQHFKEEYKDTTGVKVWRVINE